MSDFIDPPNKNEILNILLNLNKEDETEVQNFIENYFPGWLIISLNSYSKDYPHLQENWEKICKLSKCDPKKIVLVSDINFDENHIATSVISEFMTRNGYCVRRSVEFISCGNCEGAIPCENLWYLMKNNGVKTIPKTWSNTCRRC